MAFENEEDYLDNLLKSITSEDNKDSGEDLSEDSEMEMPETFVDSQKEEYADEDVFEKLFLQEEEEQHSNDVEEQSEDDEMNIMQALLNNEKAAAWENDSSDGLVDGEEPDPTLQEFDSVLSEDKAMENIELPIVEDTENVELPVVEDAEFPEIENVELPVVEDTEFPDTEDTELPEIEDIEFHEMENKEIEDMENEDFPMTEYGDLFAPDDEVFSVPDEERFPEMEDITIPELDEELFVGNNTENLTDDLENIGDFTQYQDSQEANLDDENELIGQIDGLFNDAEEELEEEKDTEQFGLMKGEDEALTGSMEVPEQQADYANLEVDDELKELLGVESAEQLADIPQESEGLSEDELVKLAEMETAASYEADPEGENNLAHADSFGNDVQDVSGPEQTKESGEKKKKSASGLMARLFSIFKKKDSTQSESADENENQKVLDELFDENGELLDDDKKIKKKGLFFRSGKNSDDDAAVDEEDLDDIESPEEIARKEEKARKKKEKKEKKEKEKQEKKEKKEQKPKKEKKPKVKKEKPPVNPADLIHVKPVAVIIMAVIVAGIVGYVYFFVSSFNYNNAMDRAAYYMADKRYTNAYRAISGIEMKSEEDIALKEQIVTIMYVQHYYDAYERYLKVDLQFEALDSLIQGIKTYDDCYQFAVEQGITADYEVVRAKLVAALEQYGITEAMARTYGAMTNYTQYKYILEGYGGISNDSGN